MSDRNQAVQPVMGVLLFRLSEYVGHIKYMSLIMRIPIIRFSNQLKQQAVRQPNTGGLELQSHNCERLFYKGNEKQRNILLFTP